MNNYPEWWNQTLTIYNKYEDPQTGMVSWKRAVVDRCFWQYTGHKFIINGSIIEANVTICRIPKDPRFVERYIWESLPEDERDAYFTLSIGDMLVKGKVEDEIDEYSSGLRSSDFLTKYKHLQGCTIIGRVAIDTDGGRVNEHYHIRGD